MFGQLWLAVLVAAHWMPFDFLGGPAAARRVDAITWVPFADLETKNYLGGMDVALTRIILLIPVGVLVAAVGRVPVGRGRDALAAGVGLAVGAVLEAGQVLLPDRYPSATDAVLAGFGAWVGAAVARRVRVAAEAAE